MSTSMFTYIAFVVFLYGLITGSFLNLCVYRIPLGISINKPRSYCESCGTSLRFCDLIPVFSYITTRGRCRYCGTKISIKHPLFELMVGVIFLLVFLDTGLSLELFIYLVLASVFILAFFIDLKHRIIPNKVVLTGFIAGIFLTLYKAFIGGIWLNNILGCIVGFSIFFICNLISLVIFKKQGIGGGDIKLMAVIGIALGLRLTITVLFISTFIGAMVSIALIMTKKLKRNDSIPYGPCLVLGTLVSVLLSNNMF